MRFRNYATAIAVCGALSACATIVTGNKQAIKVDSNPPGARVYTAVKTSKGDQVSLYGRTQAGVTPITVTIERKDGAIFLEKDGYETEEVPLHRTMNLWVLGDLLLTSLLSTSIDTSTGAAKQYDPSSYLIELRPLPGSVPISRGPFPDASRPADSGVAAPPAVSASPAPPAKAEEDAQKTRAPPSSAPAPSQAATPTPDGGRTAGTVALLAKPAANADVRRTLPPGTAVHLISKLRNDTGTWWFVSTDGDGSGWMRETELTPDPMR